MAKAKKAPDGFVIYFNGKPTLEVRWLSDEVFSAAREEVNSWLIDAVCIERDELNELVEACVASGCTSDEIDEAIRDYEAKLASCAFHSQTPEKACEHIRANFPRALYDLLRYMVQESYHYTSNNFDKTCQFSHHRPTHKSEDSIIIEELMATPRIQICERLDLPYIERRGGKARSVDQAQKMLSLAKEYENLQTDRSYGDGRNKTLWDVISYRYDNADPKWRERAKIDKDDVPDSVLDLVPQRVKLRLKKSHLALYHAATRAKINFTVRKHSNSGRSYITPSPSTLLRSCQAERRISKRTQRPIINADLMV